MFNSLSFNPLSYSPGMSLLQGSQHAVVQRPAQSDTTSDTTGNTAPTIVTGSSYSLSERFSRDDSFSISLKTKDGDQVEITFNSETRYQSDYAQRTGDGLEQQRYRIEKSQTSEFGFSVQGVLDVEEIDAIASLVQDISSLADRFFNGDLQTAMQQASDLTLDSTPLAEMDISMQQLIESRAIEKYREVQSMGEGRANEPLRAIESFREQLQNQVSRSEQRVSSATEFTLSLFVNLVQLDARFNAASETEQASIKANMGRLGELVSGRHHGHENTHESRHERENPGDNGSQGARRSDSALNSGVDTVPADSVLADTAPANSDPLAVSV